MIELLLGDCRETLKEIEPGSVQTCITSPPYFGLRDYGHDGQVGLEETPEKFVENLVEVFRGVKRVLRDDGTLWLNLGDSYVASGKQGPNSGLSALADRYAPRKNPRNLNRDDRGGVPRPTRTAPIGLKAKNLIGIPWRVAFALQADGWYLRQDIIWHKPNPMPESVTDRCTKCHEYIFLLSKSSKYYYDHEAIKEPGQDWGTRDRKKGSAFVDSTPGRAPQSGGKNCDFSEGRNKRSVWTVTTRSLKEAHFATFPPKLITPCVLAGSRPGDIVLDPFAGAGTTGLVAMENARGFIGCELNPEYLAIAQTGLGNATPGLGI